MHSISKIGIAIICLILSSCSVESNDEQIVVQHVGELRQIMHQGLVEGRVEIDTLSDHNLYALGAEAGLKGEITFVNGIPFISRVSADGIEIDKGTQTKATLLVYSHVANWDTISIDADFSNVDSLIKTHSEENQPLPFQLIGKVEALKYHVINFTGQQATFENHKQGAWVDTLKHVDVNVLGFYSTQHKGIFTHHDASTHMHFVDAEEKTSGHVDDVSFSGPIKLLIPRL